MWPFKKTEAPKNLIRPLVDMHSHLLPGIDDGAAQIEDSVVLGRSLQELGYQGLIFTPHIMGDFYKNTPEIILQKLDLVKQAFLENDLTLKTSAAAEYYLDEYFMQLLDSNERLLTFGKNHLLFEMSFMNISPLWKEAVFKLQTQGYKPILAHPERYIYLQEDSSLLQEFIDRGIYLQVNINSLTGYYSKPAQKMAERLIDNKQVQFAGSDCHHMGHIELLRQVVNSKYYQKLCELPLLNNTLFDD